MDKKIHHTDCIKCGTIKTVVIEIGKITETGVEALIKPCSSCNKQSTLKELIDHMQTKLADSRTEQK